MPSFRKRIPCTRATRVQRDLAALSSTSRRFTRRPAQILQDILSLLAQKSGSLDSRIQVLQDLLTKLPTWMEWTPRTDNVVISALKTFDEEEDQEKKSSTSDKKEMLHETEARLVDELIRLNGNVDYIDKHVFTWDNKPFDIAFIRWLHHIKTPETSSGLYIKDEEDQFVDPGTLRRLLSAGGRLHIPTRTIEAPPQLRTPPKTPPAVLRRSARIATQTRRGLQLATAAIEALTGTPPPSSQRPSALARSSS